MSQIYLGDKLIASTEGSDIKYNENTSVNEKINELNSNLPFKLAIDENGNYGYIKAGADTVIPFKTGDEHKLAIINAMANTGKGLTSSSSWDDICNALRALFPATFDVLSSYPNASNWTVESTSGNYQYKIFSSTKIELCGGGTVDSPNKVGNYATGTIYVKSPEIDITGFKNLQCNYSATYPSNIAVQLVHSGGTTNLTNGTTNISSITGKARLRFGVWHRNYDHNNYGNLLSITTCKFTA